MTWVERNTVDLRLPKCLCLDGTHTVAVVQPPVRIVWESGHHSNLVPKCFERAHHCAGDCCRSALGVVPLTNEPNPQLVPISTVSKILRRIAGAER